ncbi:hypothetical protein BD769DRAFT_1466731 [Suillus cothurnatus]|nr:hypothetical protein BD769DRAFT_1466731 [Suillus cothurnatus]
MITSTLRRHIRMFIPWFRLTVRTTAFRSFMSLLSSFLRLMRHCQDVVDRKERAFREPGSASSCYPTEQKKNTSGSLAVPEASSTSEDSKGVASNTQSPGTSSAALVQQNYRSTSEPHIHHNNAMPLDAAATEQFFHITTPIIPGQIERSGSKQTNQTMYEVPAGPLDCSK